MEWEKANNTTNSKRVDHRTKEAAEEEEEERSRRGGGEGMGEGPLLVKVMTDEQMDVLRRQIAVYATICEQLVEMHKALMAQQDSLAGIKLGGFYCDPSMIPGSHKISARQRWTPTPMQLQSLESIFDQGNGTPSKQKIREITIELSQHGQISETNVYNWFQNRRARSKRKQNTALPNNIESEAEADDESPNEKKAKSEKHPQENSLPRVDDLSAYSMGMNSEVHSIDQEPKAQGIYPSNDSSKSSDTLGQMIFYENVLSNSRIDHLIGKMDTAGSYSPFQQGEGYDMISEKKNLKDGA